MIRSRLLPALMIVFTACQGASSDPSELSEKSSVAYQLDSGIYSADQESDPNRLVRPGGYISVAVPFEPVSIIKDQIEQRTGLALRDRNEAHITVLTPPELSSVLRKLSIEAVKNAMDVDTLQKEKFVVYCVGSGKKSQSRRVEQTFFLVVQADGIKVRRAQLQKIFQKAGGSSADFVATNYTPHITIGFTKSDLFEQDGVIKDQTSCVADVETK